MDPRKSNLPGPGAQVSFASIFVGALICIGLQLLFSLVGISVGLIGLDQARDLSKETLTIGTGALLLLSVVISAGFGGYVAARLANRSVRWISTIHGVAVWAAVVAGAIFSFGNSATTFGGLLTAAGITADTAAPGKIGQELEKMKIVTDLEILKGKAVTQFVLPSSLTTSGASKNGADAALQKILKDPEVEEDAEKAREIATFASWGLLGTLLFGALSAALGGTIAFRRSVSAS